MRINRRAILAGTVAQAVKGASPSRLSMQGYIWINLAKRVHRPLASMLEELVPSATAGGFENVELSDPYFAPDLRATTLELLDKHRLRMPSVYVGGPMHENALADQTISKALAITELCKPYGCRAIVHNSAQLPGNAAKSDAQLAIQAASIGRMAEVLGKSGMELRIHHHEIELQHGAREYRHILAHTDPKLVRACIDVEFVYRAGFAPAAFVKEIGPRVAELHLRSRIGNTPLEAFEPGDIDYAGVASALRGVGVKPLAVVELAYHDDTAITRSFEINVKRSRQYAEELFGP